MKDYGRLGRDLVDRVLGGGFPAPLERTTWSRRLSWYREYTDALVKRDIYDLAKIGTYDATPKLLELAAQAGKRQL